MTWAPCVLQDTSVLCPVLLTLSVFTTRVAILSRVLQMLLAFSGNNVIGILAKSVSSIMLFASLTHPLDVVSHRMMAG